MRLADRYRVLRRVGEGGGGGVWLVEDRLADDAVMVLKRLHAHAQASLAQWLVNEFQILAQLDLPTVARVHDFGLAQPDAEDPGGTFFTREFVDGTPLDEALNPPTPSRVRALFVSAAETLRELHRLGVVHGDLKPANLIVPRDADRVALIDFGLAQGALGAAAKVRGGTLGFMPPERQAQLLAGEALSPDPRADVYALCMTLRAVLAGNALPGHDPAPPPAVESEPALRPLWELATRGSAEDPARRFGTVDDLLVALGETGAASLQGRVVLRPEGREHELGVLLDALARRLVRREAGVPVVLLRGDEGSGRSTLLRELAWRAQLRGVQTLGIQCAPGDGPARRLREAAEILSGGAVDRDAPDALATAFRKAAATAPVLVLADDLDRADPGVAALLRSLAYGCEAHEPLLVIATACDEARVKGLDPALRVSLGALDEPAVASLCAQILGAVEPAVVASVHRRTGGSPLAVTEVLLALSREAGVTPADVDRVEIPTRARDVAQRRVGALTPTSRAAAAVVAAFDGEATADLLRPLVPSWSDVEAARAAGVVTVRADGRWAITHAALEPALLASLDPDARAAVLRDVAEALDAAAARCADPREAPSPSSRARLWLRAGDVARARPHVAEAVASLRREGLPLAAVQLLAAMRAASPDATPPEAVYEEAELLHEGGELAEADALAATLSEGDGPCAAKAAVLRARLRRLSGDLAEAERLALRVADVARDRDRGLFAEALLEATRVSMLHGDYAAVRARCDEVIAASDAPSVRASARGLGGLAALYASDTARGMAMLDDARGEFASLSLPREEATLFAYLAIGRERLGDLAGARALHEQALDRARSAGDLRTMVTCRINLGHVAQRVGDLGAAIEHNQAALKLSQRAGLRSAGLHARINTASQLIRVGSLDRARAELDAVLEQGRETGHRDLVAAATLMLGVTRVRTGDVDAGLGLIAEAESQFTALGQSDDAADALLDACEAVLDRGAGGDVDRGAESLSRAREVCGDLGLRAARAKMLEGRVLLARGDARGAAKALGEAIAEAESQRDWEVLAQSLAARALVHATTGAELHARRDRERAVEVLEEKAALLPPDLRSAFWSVSRRASLRTETSAMTPPASEMSVEPRSRRAGATAMPGPRGAAGNVNAPTLIASDERLVLLLELSKRLGEEHSLDRVLDQAVQSAVELTNAERGAVLLDEGGRLEVRVRHGVHRGDGPDDQVSRSIAETVWIDGEPVVTLNAQGDRRFADFKSVHELGVCAVAAVPMRVRGRTLGVLYVESRRRRVAWAATDIALMAAFAEQAGIAVEHARLVEELEARTRDLEAARQELTMRLETRTHELETARTSLVRAQEALSRRFTPGGLVANTEAMRKVFALIERVRDSDVSVVVEGESGTGKELVARALHFSGARAKGPFVVVHCGAIPETLLESELFGHVKGAFTGADKDRRGLIASAHGGTLMLDEVSEMPLRMQVEMLRVLQDRRVRPVGSDRDEVVDARIVAASNRPLADLVAEGRFREDLYYRLSVVSIRIPPLRERLEDIPALAAHFLTAFSEEHGGARRRLSRDAMHRLVRYAWPGNVRQLRHALESAAVLSEGDLIEAEALPLPSDGHDTSAPPRPSSPPPPGGSGGVTTSALRKASERQRIVDALEQVNWNKVRAAQVLGMPRRTLYRRLREYGLLD